MSVEKGSKGDKDPEAVKFKLMLWQSIILIIIVGFE
jgi:hypothetical protein